MISLLIRWLVNTLALFIVAHVVDGIDYTSIVSLAIAALVLGLLNAIVKPLLFWLTLPLTIVTLGLFVLVLNAAMLGLTALLIPGFTIEGFWPAILGAILLAIISFFTSWIGREKRER